MRLLLIPVYNYPNNLDADSIWNITRDWSIRFLEANPDVAITRLVPILDIDDPLHRFRRTETVVGTGHPRLHDLPVEMWTLFDLEETNWDATLFQRYHPMIGTHPVDGVICTSAIKLVGIKARMNTAGAEAYMPPFFSFDMLLRGMGSNEVGGVHPDEMLLQAVGQSMAHTLFESPKCERISMDTARRYLAPSQVKKLSTDALMAYTGFEADEVGALPLADRNAEFTVIVRGRITSSKNVDAILDLYNKRVAAGHKLRVLLTTGNVTANLGAVAEELFKNKSVEMLRIASKKEANEVMRKAHAFVLWSTHELFCVSLWEMFAAGLIGIIKDADWHKGMLPPDYPFVFKTEVQAYVMLADVQENYAAWQEKLAWVKDWVIEKYSYQRTVPATAAFIREKVEAKIPKPRDWLKPILDKGAPTLTLEEAFEFVGKHAELGDRYLRSNSPHRIHHCVGPRELAWALIESGYVEDLTKVDPIYTKS